MITSAYVKLPTSRQTDRQTDKKSIADRRLAERGAKIKGYSGRRYYARYSQYARCMSIGHWNKSTNVLSFRGVPIWSMVPDEFQNLLKTSTSVATSVPQFSYI